MEGPVQYREPDIETIQGKIKEITGMWRAFIETYETTSSKECLINGYALAEVVSKVERRKKYYTVFHKIEEGHLDEYKEAALLCYWIVKLKPFQMLHRDAALYKYPNEAFGMHIIFSIFMSVCDRGKYVLPPAKYRRELRYSLRYREISEDALIDIVEGLAVGHSCGPPASK